MVFVQELQKIATQLPFKAPPVPVGHPYYGRIGEVVPQRGFYLKGMSWRTFNAILKDEERVQRNPESFFKKLKRYILDEEGALTSWSEVFNARTSGKADDRLLYKASQTTVANNWSCFYRSGGVPSAGSYANIPNGAAHNVNSAGAFPLTNPASGEKKYLLSFGANHLTGANVVALIDLLVAAGNINANTTSTQTVNTTALTRYTDGEGVYMILEVTTALGSTAANVTVNYTNQAGTSGRSTGALAMTTSAVVYRLQPTAGGMLIPLQAGDYGVRSVETITFSAAMGAGVVAILLYKPLLLIPTLANTTFVEMPPQSVYQSVIELVTDSNGNIGCLTVFVLTSSTSTGVQTYFIKTVSG